MNPQNKWLKITGFVLNALIAAIMILAGLAKIILLIFGLFPPEALEKMADTGLDGKILMIGIGELVAGVLLLIPRTSPLGTLVTSGFWGGVICFHMTHNEDYLAYCVLLALTWVGAYLRGSVPLLAPKSGGVASSGIAN
jgi:uncharacterized membrane protein YphA (DoxX/SURF4 family)